MSTASSPTTVATVISVSGLAFARNADGAVRRLAAGDTILENEIVFTMADGQVELAFSDGHNATILPSESYLIGPEAMIATSPDVYEASIAAAGEVGKVVTALEGQGDILEGLEAPAAGAAGAENSGNSFVRLLRIVEPVTPIGFEFPVNPIGDIRAPEGTVIAEEEPVITFSISVDKESISEEGEESATFTISMTGFPLEPGSTATVNLGASGSATGTVDYLPELLDALDDAISALPPGSGVTLSGSTLTFASDYDGSPISFTVSAEDDDLIEGIEDIIASLSNPTLSNGTAIIVNGQASVDITETDTVNFAIQVSDESGLFGQTATISEEDFENNQGTFRVTMGGNTLTNSNTASVTIGIDGLAIPLVTDPDFSGLAGDDGTDPTDAILEAIKAAADAVLAVDAVIDYANDTVTVTWSAGDPAYFEVDLTAFDDEFKDSGENLKLVLSNPSIEVGPTPTIVSGQGDATLTINDIDAGVTFAITVASENPVDDLPSQYAIVKEEDPNDNLGTFTITKGGDALQVGNTASVTIIVSGLASDADFDGMSGSDYAEILAAIQAAAEDVGLIVTNITSNSLTVTWDHTDPNSFSVDLTAFNDTIVDPESLILTLDNETVDAGAASLVSGQESATLAITDNEVQTLNLNLTVNSNQTTQYILVEFTQNGNHFEHVIALDAQGQQDINYNYAFDVGFEITDDPYTLSMKYLGNTAGTSGQVINITDLYVEGTRVDAAHGNIKLGDGGSSHDGFVATIDPPLALYTLVDDVYPVGDYWERTDINGTVGDNILNGTPANESIDAKAGNDTVTGGDGDDVIFGAAGNDSLTGGTGNDGIVGGLGNDTLHGGDSLDLLDGGAGNDVLYGDGGNDVLFGGLGADTLTGGAGADRFGFRTEQITDGQIDHITDYNYADGDSVDIADLLVDAGVDVNAPTFNLTNYLTINSSGAIMWDADGAGGSAAVQIGAIDTLLNVGDPVRIVIDLSGNTTDLLTS